MTQNLPYLMNDIQYMEGGNPRSNIGIVFMHGLGGSADDLKSCIELMCPQLDAHLLYLQAPVMLIEAYDQEPMRAWYNIYALGTQISNRKTKQDIQGLQSRRHDLTKALLKWFSDHTCNVVGGFSQGGAMALELCLTQNLPIAGTFAWCSYLPNDQQYTSPMRPSIPVWIGHGMLDPVLPISWAESAAKQIEHMGHAVTLRTYPNLQHHVSSSFCNDWYQWLHADVIPSHRH